ncbi:MULTISPECIES: PadR family transcriptional regulator [unclassified Saccharopolyspora]|uniref:PadR family transcriptional regulator n=1 Tax=unclassified Saccharopolyspora TaxID=2646250 RepID=UPI001CD2DAC0|nr:MULTISPECIES: PadR family transcriptional regulator [unclassified Saccharopolyspora]MCA1185965.1 PadR family transcriptional regulator [Saccharopolyspora sp. 6T]MCA1280743.1 PadR family transcriptional regulator [Saccharopolyspora sp. 7B]
MNDSVAAWPAAWIRAAMPTAILATLERGPLHGYAIAAGLEGLGMGRPRGGSLYPLLGTLESSGAIAASWHEGDGGPGRRAYTLTAAGRERLARERGQWTDLVTTLSSEHTDHEGERS